MNKKVVNIYPTTPVLSTNPPIRTMAYKITKPIKDIRACIIAGAKVEEVLPNGSTIRLNLNNYDKDHIAIYNKIKSKESETTLKPIKTEVSKNSVNKVKDKNVVDNDAKTISSESLESIDKVEKINKPYQYKNHKKNKKKYQANNDKVVDSTSKEEPSEVSTAEAIVLTDNIDADLIETIDVETLL